MLAEVRWSEREVARFLGTYLSEPKPNVTFARPQRPLPPMRFARAFAMHGVRLDARTTMLFRSRRLFVNGEELLMPAPVRGALVRLADARSLPGGETPTSPLLDLLHQWYGAGYLHLGNRP
jgi:50S ribosomal protein L16 3-hydroxylase